VKTLLHMCCGPCAIVPVRELQSEGLTVMGFFYRYNIHPFTECLKREDSLRLLAEKMELKIIYQEGYELEKWLQGVVHREANRCKLCYYDRLRTTALLARRGRFDSFSSTLLYSKHQRHETIRSLGESIATEVGIPFLYRDFRAGWKEGIESSKNMGLYRQQYCGCIYSEKERYCRPESMPPPKPPLPK